MISTSSGLGIRGLADPRRSRAVLIGAWDFKALGGLPAVEHGLAEVHRLLTDPKVWGLPEENCVVIGQNELGVPGGDKAALQAIHDAAAASRDAIIVYYAGHGLLDPTDHRQLRLALPGSRPDHRFSSLAYEDVRKELAVARRAKRLVILDCCFAGLAMQGGMGAMEPMGSRELAALASANGAFLMAAAAATEEAVSPPGEEFTAFSGELIRILSNGADDGPEFWDVESLFDRVHEALADKGRPLPELLSHNRGSQLCLARNVGFHPESVLDPALVGLLKAQVRAADGFMYRLVGAHRSMVDVYVRQDLRAVSEETNMSMSRSDSSDENRQTTTRRNIGPPQRLQEALTRHQHLTVSGGPGLGKSTQSVQLAAEFAGHWLSGSGSARDAKIVPLRVVAGLLAVDDGAFDEALVRSASGALGKAVDAPLPTDLLDRGPPDSRWLVLVDGLDEIADAGLRQSLIGLLRSRSKEENARIRFVLFTRPLPPRELDEFGFADSHYFLQPFDGVRLNEFAYSWFTHGTATAEGFLGQVLAASLADLVQVPLLATIAAIAYEFQPDRPLPSNRYGLYEQYLRYLATEKSEDAESQWLRLEKRLSVLSSREQAAAATLFHRRMEFVGRLAEAVTAGETDLVGVAIRHLADETGVRLSAVAAWRDHVGAALNSTGLFSYESGVLAFIHASFSDHLDADAQARRLPETFDLADPRWAKAVDDALATYSDHGRAVLVHHAYLHPTDFKLLDALQARDGTRLLAGRLLAEGVPSLPTHLDSFRSSLRAEGEAWWRGRFEDWLTVAGRLNDRAVQDYLRAVVGGREWPSAIRIHAAVALRGVEIDLAVRTLRSYLTSTADADDYDERDIQEAGIALAGFGPAYIAEVVHAFLTDSRVRSVTGGVLGVMRPQQAAEALMVLRALYTDGSSAIREAAAVALATVEPDSCLEIVEALILNADATTEESLDSILDSIYESHEYEVTELLARLMRHNDPLVRILTGRLADRWGYGTSVLGIFLRDDDPLVWSSAADFLNMSITAVEILEAFAIDETADLELERIVQHVVDLGPGYVQLVGRKLAYYVPTQDPEESMRYVRILLAFGPALAGLALTVLGDLARNHGSEVRAIVAQTAVTMALKHPETAGRAIDMFTNQAGSIDQEILATLFARLLTADESFVRDHALNIWRGCSETARPMFNAVVRSLDRARTELIAAVIDREIRANRVIDATPPKGVATVRLGPVLEGWVDALVEQLRVDIASFGPDETEAAATALLDAITQWSSEEWPVAEVLARLSHVDSACAAIIGRVFPQGPGMFRA